MSALHHLARVSKRLEADHLERDRLIAEATREGKTRRQVAGAARLSVGAVQKIAKRAGVLGVFLTALVAASSASASPAMHGYQRIWKQDRRFYAPGMPAPLVKFNQPVVNAWADTTFPLGASRVVEVGRGMTRALADPLKAATFASVLEWEWGRVFGPRDQGIGDDVPWLHGLQNRMIRYHRRGSRSPLGYARAHLPHWGENPRGVFDPAPPQCQPGWHLVPDTLPAMCEPYDAAKNPPL